MFIYLNFDTAGTPSVNYYVRSPLPSSFLTTEVNVEILIKPPVSPPPPPSTSLTPLHVPEITLFVTG